MCDDSRSERQYWMRRVEQLRKQMEREDLERQPRRAGPSARPETGGPEPLSGRSGVSVFDAPRAWALGSLLAGIVVALSILLFSVPGTAATFVYVSNAEDGDIGLYTLQPDGSLKSGGRYKAEKVVMPMTVSPDKRFLVAAVRSKPFSAYTYSIDRASGALTLVGTGPLAESFPYIFHDRTGRFLLGASDGTASRRRVESMKRTLISSGSEFEEQVGYSRAVVQGDWVFVSGTTGFDYSTMTIAEGIREQTEQCLKNIETALVQAGSSLKDIVRVTYVLPDGDEFRQCWPILRQYLGVVRPAATMICAKLMDPRMRIEIEATALKRG